MKHVVVVGGGLAGARSVQELRAQGYEGAITMLAAEPHVPYDRPPLSKEVLRGDDGHEHHIRLDVAWDELDVDLQLGRAATGLREGVVETADGEVPYDGLVIASGGVPLRLKGSGFALRTLDDALQLAVQLTQGGKVAIVGAGWIGAEVATGAAQAGCAVTVIEAGPAPLAALPSVVGELTIPWYADLGIDLRLNSAAKSVQRKAVVLESGEKIAADLVLVAIGAAPETSWLAGSAVAVDHGVLVDEHLATNLPGVVAVGDCVARWSPRYETRLRVEHWDDALHGPAVAVATLLGKDAVYDPIPYFWSDQLGHTIQWAGFAKGTDSVVRRGEPGDPNGWAFCWLAGDRLVAMLTVDRPRDLVQGRRRMTEGFHPDPARLADPAVPVKSA
ncbi:MAG: 3-phenylpropionate/trans-cinnamate dioxygenase ferredoxin reductase component [Actinomycetota bacterium]|jgi:3-phenylpropionate/trans-cinnamate dioxygenase ferredoxin reductase subunit|nr:3-phenylpropionate/trans-cinnamate dioxygenase ferredoxin reductase component [Actinomycetota bacterium]